MGSSETGFDRSRDQFTDPLDLCSSLVAFKKVDERTEDVAKRSSWLVFGEDSANFAE